MQDAEGEIGTIIAAAPSYESVTAVFHGVAAHAGMKPEYGSSAMQAAVRAIAAAEYDVLPGPPKPGKIQLLREVGLTLRGEG